MENTRRFLTARWDSLVLLNYVCSADLLRPYVPVGTELDECGGHYWVSLVGFLFRDTRVRGIPIPFHRTFEEVNLRFYVRRNVDGQIRRAVVFISELVPRRAIAAVARWVYNEPYRAVPMAHVVALDPVLGGSAEYSWKYGAQGFALSADAEGPAKALEPHSEAEFITDQYWGYTRQRNGSTLEYRVDHPSWLVWEAETARFAGPASVLYGDGFATVLAGEPRSAHIAVGSPVTVYAGRRV